MSKIGDPLTFTAHIEDAAGADLDPTTVKFYLREEIDGTELEWNYAGSPVSGTDYPTGQNPVVKDSAGDYHVLFIARKAERITAYWKCTNSATFTLTQSPSTVLVRHAGIALVEP